MADDGRSRGGKARAASMTPERRKEIAERAAAKRHGIPTAIYGSPDKPLRIGEATLQCYVLEDETRVITQSAFLQALGRHPKASVRAQEGEEQVPPILQGSGIKPFISQDVLEKTRPIQFLPPTGGRASGYRAEALPAVCEVYLRAREEGVLLAHQRHIAQHAELLIRALANVGIIALVDEATGYQAVRARAALEQILEKFIAEDLRKWAKVFPDDFYREMFRLRGWDYEPGNVKRPGVIGHDTNDLVYARLAPGVLEELRTKNPKTLAGRRKHKHFQWLTDDVGDPRLREHIASVTTLMRASKNWADFKRMIDVALPKYGETMAMQLDD